MTIMFNHKMIDLKQEKMASGIKYTNKIYTEWHRDSILYKTDLKIFEVILPATNKLLHSYISH